MKLVDRGLITLSINLNLILKKSVLISMKGIGDYQFALLKHLLDKHFTITLINPKSTDFTYKMQSGITINDKIYDLPNTPELKKTISYYKSN